MNSVSRDDAEGRATEPDEALARRLLADGDEAAFDALYDRHAPAMYQFALRLCGGNDADAQDVVQETWMRAADRLHAFEWRSRLRTWLQGIVLNAARELIDRRRRRRRLDGEPAADGEDRRSDGRGGAAAVTLERALASLPDAWRLVVLLHDLEGHTHEEIARLLEIPPGTSKSRLHRGRRRIRRLLGSRPPRTGSLAR